MPQLMMVIGVLLLLWWLWRVSRMPPPPELPPMSAEEEADLMRPVTEWVAEAEAEAVRQHKERHV